jgi:hypothetical protein
MKMAMVLLRLLVGQFAHAEQPDAQRPHWIIMLTVVDRDTGKALRQSKLGGSELEFENAAHCKSILEKIETLEADRVTTVLRCQREAAPLIESPDV